MKINKYMRPFLTQALHDAEDVKLPDDLMEDVRAGFKEIDGCVVSKTYDLEHLDKAGDDDTEIECDLNKAHIGRSAGVTNMQEALALAFAYSGLLKDSLAKSNVFGPFRMIVSANHEGDHPAATVRFHRRREGQKWLLDDLEVYQQPVAVIDF